VRSRQGEKRGFQERLLLEKKKTDENVNTEFSTSPAGKRHRGKERLQSTRIITSSRQRKKKKTEAPRFFQNKEEKPASL